MTPLQRTQTLLANHTLQQLRGRDDGSFILQMPFWSLETARQHGPALTNIPPTLNPESRLLLDAATSWSDARIRRLLRHWIRLMISLTEELHSQISALNGPINRHAVIIPPLGNSAGPDGQPVPSRHLRARFIALTRALDHLADHAGEQTLMNFTRLAGEIAARREQTGLPPLIRQQDSRSKGELHRLLAWWDDATGPFLAPIHPHRISTPQLLRLIASPSGADDHLNWLRQRPDWHSGMTGALRDAWLRRDQSRWLTVHARERRFMEPDTDAVERRHLILRSVNLTHDLPTSPHPTRLNELRVRQMPQAAQEKTPSHDDAWAYLYAQIAMELSRALRARHPSLQGSDVPELIRITAPQEESPGLLRHVGGFLNEARATLPVPTGGVRAWRQVDADREWNRDVAQAQLLWAGWMRQAQERELQAIEEQARRTLE